MGILGANDGVPRAVAATSSLGEAAVAAKRVVAGDEAGVSAAAEGGAAEG